MSKEGWKEVAFTEESFKRFKLAYQESVKRPNEDENFVFEGNTYFNGYAKYLIEYLESERPWPPFNPATMRRDEARREP